MIFLDNVHVFRIFFTYYEETSPLPPLFLSIFMYCLFLYRIQQPYLYQQFEIHLRIDLSFYFLYWAQKRTRHLPGSETCL